MKTGLEIAERLEKEHGLAFSDEEKEDLRLLRDKLPTLEKLFQRGTGDTSTA